MSEIDRDEVRKDIDKYSYSKYENLNNNQLKYKKKIPSDLNDKYRGISLEEEERSERTYDNKGELSYDYSYKKKKRSSYSSNYHRRQEYSCSRSRSKSRTISRKDNTSKYRNSEYKDDRKKSHRHHHHHHHHRKHKHSKRHHKDHSSRTKSKERYREEREESMRRHLLKANSLNAYLQGKSSHIFYDDNYLPLSSNPYKYLGKPGLEDNSTYLDNEIPISTSDIIKKPVELYVMNLPRDLDKDQIKELLNAALISIGANEKSGNPIINVTQDKSGKYFILEFRTPNECKNAMGLNEMKIMSRTLKIGQPKYANEKDGNNYTSYNTNSGSQDLFPILSSFGKEFDSKKGIDNRFNSVLMQYQNKVNNLINGQNSLYNTSTMGYNNLNLFEYKNLYGNQTLESNKPEPGTKLHVMNLPESFDENYIIQLFKKFGKIKRIELINDEETDKFNGQCYLEYEEEKSYQDAIKYGTGLKLGDNFLLINKINVKENNKVDNNKIKNINAENYKSTSSLGILASSINLGAKSKIS